MDNKNDTYNNVLLIVAFLMMIFIFINELKNMSLFIYKYKSIKDMAKINMDHYCNGVYCEAETDRFQLAKHMYDLVLPNDIYNAKTYTILLLIYSIIFFIVAYFQYTGVIADNKSYMLNILMRILIPLFLLLCIIINLVARYMPYDEKGYYNYFYNKDHDETNKSFFYFAFNNTIILLFLILGVIGFLVCLFLKNSDNNDNYKFKCSIYWLYLMFAFYFMFNMINIVETFKNNKVPYELLDTSTDDKKKAHINHWTADISHGSENVFYYNFFNLKNVPEFMDTKVYGWTVDDKISERDSYLKDSTYDYYLFYYIRNLMQFAFVSSIIVFLLILLLIGFYIWNNKIYQEYVLPFFTPFIALTALVLFIIGFTTFNTGFNKYVLYGVHGSCYKQSLNELNNVLVPYIAMHENYTGAGMSTQNNYLYHYIVLNVLVSYLKNYITLNNIAGAQDNDFADYKKTDDMKLNKIKFNKIEVNDINDLYKFEEYYKGLMRKVLQYEKDNIPTNLKVTDIDEKYISLLNKIFLFKDSSSTNFTYSNTSASVTDYKTNIKNAVYYCINLLNLKSFNTNIEKYNSDQTTLATNLYFYTEKDFTSFPYKFLLKPASADDADKLKKDGRSSYAEDPDTKKIIDPVLIDPIIEVFLEQINSLYSDLSEYNNDAKTTKKKEGIFKGNIYTSFTMLSSTTGNKPYYPSTTRKSIFKTIPASSPTEYENLVLYYLYNEMIKTIKVPLDTNNNYLKNAIENMYYQLNKSNATVNLYDVDIETDKLKFTKDPPNANLHNSQYLKAWNKVDDNQIADGVKHILDNANKYANQNYFFAYFVNIVILIIMYYAIVKKNQ